jgi:hypothetical protein
MANGYSKAKIQIKDLGASISETLTIYHTGIINGIDFCSQKAVEKLAKKTKATAPVGARGSYKKNITSGLVKQTRRCNTYAWYVKPPDHRLTHLLVHGHATKDGGRTKANSFLHTATEEVLETYRMNVEEVFEYYGKPRKYPDERS